MSPLSLPQTYSRAIIPSGIFILHQKQYGYSTITSKGVP